MDSDFMKYVVDRIIENIVVLENIESREMIEVSIELVPEGVKDGSILIFSEGLYQFDIDEETSRRESIREKMERLKRLKNEQK